MSYFVPPCNYGMVEYDLSRSGQCHQLNFPFLERLNLKTVIYLSYDQPSHALYVSTLCVTYGVLLFFLFFRSVIWVSQTLSQFCMWGKKPNNIPPSHPTLYRISVFPKNLVMIWHVHWVRVFGFPLFPLPPSTPSVGWIAEAQLLLLVMWDSLSFLDDQGIELRRPSGGDEETDNLSSLMSEAEVLSALQVFTKWHICYSTSLHVHQ
jgi:hypothetical protein